MIIQIVSILYRKECRGAPYTSNRYTFTQDIEKQAMDIGYSRAFNQDKNGIVPYTNHINYFDIVFSDNVINLAFGIIEKKESILEVSFIYKSNMGLPHRKDAHAFNLKADMYGKIMYNGRFQYFDDVYYQYCTINILNNTRIVNTDFFITQKPDIIFKQIASMF